MHNNNLTIHMVVKNEDRFIWYSISSILPFASKVFITDTGSSDRTVKIVSTFRDKKIIFNQRFCQKPQDISTVRQEQIKNTKTDWLWIVDGDEVYPKSLCQEIKKIIKVKGNNLEGIVVGRYDLLGDIYHYQDESVGQYNLFGKKGHIVLRLINKKNIPGLHVEGMYPYEGYYDKNGIQIIYHHPQKFAMTQGKLFHAMYLIRSSKGANLADTLHRRKWKIESGKKFPVDHVFPEVFNLNKPHFVPDVSIHQSIFIKMLAIVITPMKKIKRLLFASMI